MEELPLLSEGPPTKKTNHVRTAGVGAAVVLVMFLGAVTLQNKSQSPPLEANTISTSTFDGLQSVNMKSFAATNADIQTYGASGTDYPWMDGLLVEPYSETTFYSHSGKAGSWELIYSDGSVTSQASSASSFIFQFEGVGEYTMTFTNDETSESESANIYVRYVRREIRALTDKKLTKFKAAFQQIIEINEEVTGKKLYGDNFTPFSKLSALHANYAGSQECDHLHDGMGFIVSHVHMSRLMELSLQSVDPALSLPYWEYTKDVEHIISEHNGDYTHWKDIEIFSEKYFGYTNEDTAQIETGEFRAITMVGDPKFSTVTNSYGLMRAPWNNLGNLKMTRYFGGGSASYTKLAGEEAIVPKESLMSTCENLYTFLDSEATDMATFTEYSQSLIHGPIHLVTGGIAGTPDLINFAKNTLGLKVSIPGYTRYWNTVSSFFIVVSRAIYRHKLLSCPEVGSCIVGVTAEKDCACTCDATEVIKTLRDKTLTNYGFTTHLSTSALQALTEYYCSGGVVTGDQAAASAASDPTFYSLHGTVERYLQLARLAGKFTDESWPSREDSLFKNQVHPFSESCIGHYEDDKLLFGQVDGKTMTNVEYYAHLDPKKTELSYIYDNFEFEHCTNVGYDIKAAAQP